MNDKINYLPYGLIFIFDKSRISDDIFDKLINDYKFSQFIDTSNFNVLRINANILNLFSKVHVHYVDNLYINDNFIEIYKGARIGKVNIKKCDFLIKLNKDARIVREHILKINDNKLLEKTNNKYTYYHLKENYFSLKDWKFFLFLIKELTKDDF